MNLEARHLSWTRLIGGAVCVALCLSGPATYGQPTPQPVPTNPPMASPDAAPAAPEPAASGAVAPAPPPPPQSIELTTAELPRDLTPFGMFMSADIIVKAVMLGLIVASVLTWTIWLAKTLELWGARRRLNHAQRALAAARSLAEGARAAAAASLQVAKLLEAVDTELQRGLGHALKLRGRN